MELILIRVFSLLAKSYYRPARNFDESNFHSFFSITIVAMPLTFYYIKVRYSLQPDIGIKICGPGPVTRPLFDSLLTLVNGPDFFSFDRSNRRPNNE
jgi:hypothetical protein